jgi:bromodomain-containing protein 8
LPRTLLQEIEDIQNGAWDERLTSSYILLEASDDPAKARYAHSQSTAVQPSLPTSAQVVEPAAQQPASPVRRSSRSSRSPTHKQTGIDNASASVEGDPSIAQIADSEVKLAVDTSQPESDMASEVLVDAAKYPPEQALPDIPEEIDSQEVGPVPTKTSKPASRTATKPPIAERRSSTRTSRNSISNLSELAPIASTGAIASASAVEEPADRAASPKSAAMEHDSSHDSQPSTARKGSRGTRRASLPRETNKRKRGTTPLDVRGPSPAISERSRNKRVKTEEPDSSVGTPAADQDRTPSGSEAAARRFRNSAPLLIGQMHGNIRSNFFKDPVKPNEALNYYDIVKRPMDLRTLLQGVKNGRLSSTIEFKRDVAL